MQDAIEIDALCKRYGAFDALRDVSASVPQGQVVGLLGHNGAGKSTLIKLVLGLIAPSSGRIRVLGKAPRGRQAHALRRHLGYLPENIAFYANLTGLEVIDYLARLKGVPTKQGRQLLERVGLGHAAGRRVAAYSKGMRQRLGLAQALLNSPKLVLLDEPTSGLDPQATRELYALVDELRAAGCCVLISSHLLAELEPHVDGALILREGRLLAAGRLVDLRRQAGLPSLIQLRLQPQAEASALFGNLQQAGAAYEVGADGQVEVRVSESGKLDLLRLLLGHPVIANVELAEPSLARLYDWWGAGKASPGEPCHE